MLSKDITAQGGGFHCYYQNHRLNAERLATLEDARETIYAHPAYKKSHFGKKGYATTRNPSADERFSIYDTVWGYCWSIRN